MITHTSRVVVVSSESHRFSNYPNHELNETNVSPPPSKYWSMLAYNNAKLANVLFAKELARVSPNFQIEIINIDLLRIENLNCNSIA